MVRTYKLKTERRSLDEERMKTTISKVTSKHSFQQLNDHIQKRLSTKKHGFSFLRKGREKGKSRVYTDTPEKNRLQILYDKKQRKREVKLAKQKAKELKTTRNLLRLTETKKPKKIKFCLRLKPDSDSSENEFLKLSDDDDDEELDDRGEEEFDIPDPENINIGEFLLIKFEEKKTVDHYVAKVISKYSFSSKRKTLSQQYQPSKQRVPIEFTGTRSTPYKLDISSTVGLWAQQEHPVKARFDEYYCICGGTWNSRLSWEGNYQICKRCKRSVQPYSQYWQAGERRCGGGESRGLLTFWRPHGCFRENDVLLIFLSIKKKINNVLENCVRNANNLALTVVNGKIGSPIIKHVYDTKVHNHYAYMLTSY